MQIKWQKYALFGCYAVCVLLILSSLNNIYFWDTIQFGSRHAHWFFEHDFEYFFLPDNIDSGHPPGFGMFIAFMWTLFGKSLLVSHLVMLPFLLLAVYWANKIGNQMIGLDWGVLYPIFLIANANILGHAILISPDLLVVSFFLGILYAHLKSKPKLKAVLVILLACISLRGMMLAFAFFVFELWYFKRKDIKAISLQLWPYLPGGIVGLAYLIAHYFHKSWLVFHVDSPWAGSFESAEFTGMMKNLVILAWRFLDFGNIFLWIGLAVLIWFLKRAFFQNNRRLILLIIVLTVLTALPLINYTGLTQHRYLLTIYILLGFLFLSALSQWKTGRRAKIILSSLILTGMLSGHFWVYPISISQGWDTTLAHVPYYELREEAKSYLKLHNIDEQEVGTVFPAKTQNKYLYLNDDVSGFKELDFQNDHYVLYSNIYNDFTDTQLKSLFETWNINLALKKRGVQMILFSRKE